MRRAAVGLAGLVLLGACTMPVGGEIEPCGAEADTIGVAVPETGVIEAAIVPLRCYRVARESRIELVFAMPPGPECHGVSIVDAVEGNDAVSITLWVGRLSNPFAGACPEEEQLWAVPLELNRALGDRAVLDASQPGD